MKRITTKLTFRVPSWDFCMLQDPKNPFVASKRACRFCTKEGVCCLFNMPVPMVGGMPHKLNSCKRLSAWKQNDITDSSDLLEGPASELFEELASVYSRALSEGYGVDQAIAIALRRLGRKR